MSETLIYLHNEADLILKPHDVRFVSDAEINERRARLGLDQDDEPSGIESYEIVLGDQVIAHFHINGQRESEFWFCDDCDKRDYEDLVDTMNVFRNEMAQRNIDVLQFVHTKNGKKILGLPKKLENTFTLATNKFAYRVPVSNPELEVIKEENLIDEHNKLRDQVFLEWSINKDRKLAQDRRRRREEVRKKMEEDLEEADKKATQPQGEEDTKEDDMPTPAMPFSRIYE